MPQLPTLNTWWAFKFDGHEFRLKKLELANFLEFENFLPLTFFEQKTPDTVYDKMKSILQKDQADQRVVEAITQIVKTHILRIDGQPVPDPWPEWIDNGIITVLYLEILSHSVTRFIGKCAISETTAVSLDAVAHRYGKLPSEIVFRDGGVTDIERWMFDSHCFVAGVRSEVEARNRAQKSR